MPVTLETLCSQIKGLLSTEEKENEDKKNGEK